MTQYARPVSDFANAWNNGWEAINEVTPADGDFTYTDDNPADDVLEVNLGSISTPSGTADQVVRWRRALIDTGVLAGSAGTGCDLTVELWEGDSGTGTLIATCATAETLDGLTAWTTTSYTLTTGEAGSIGDYSVLNLVFSATGGGGSPTNRRGAGVSWAVFDTPDAAPPPNPMGVDGQAIANASVADPTLANVGSGQVMDVAQAAANASVSDVTFSPGPVLLTPDQVQATASVADPVLAPGAMTLDVGQAAATASVADVTFLNEVTRVDVTWAQVTVPLSGLPPLTMAVEQAAATATVAEPTFTGAAFLTPDQVTAAATVADLDIAAGTAPIALTPDQAQAAATVADIALAPGLALLTPDVSQADATVSDPTLDNVGSAQVMDVAQASSLATVDDGTLSPGAVLLVVAQAQAQATVADLDIQTGAPPVTLVVDQAQATASVSDVTFIPGLATLDPDQVQADATVGDLDLQTGAAPITMVVDQAQAAATVSDVTLAPGLALLSPDQVNALATVADPTIHAWAIYRPDEDLSLGGWLNELGSTPVYPSLDESTPDDGDYGVSPDQPSAAALEVGFSPIGDPGIDDLHFLRYRYERDGSGTVNLQVDLVSGTTVCATWNHNGISTLVQADQELSQAQVQAIRAASGHGDLRVRFTADVP